MESKAGEVADKVGQLLPIFGFDFSQVPARLGSTGVTFLEALGLITLRKPRNLAVKIGMFSISRRRFIEGGLTLGFFAAAPRALSTKARPDKAASKIIDLGTHVAVDGWVIRKASSVL